MIAQVWDEELEYMARLWANRCIFEDNNDRHAESSNFDYVGENKLAVSSSSINYTILITAWFNEKELYHYTSANCIDAEGYVDSELCEDYTQVCNLNILSLVTL